MQIIHIRYLSLPVAVCLSRLLCDAAFAQEPKAGEILPAPRASAPSYEPLKCDEACVRSNAKRASEICARRIEAQAPGDFEWISRPYAGIFQQADPSKDDQAIATYRGDSIRFLSPQKEWIRVSYECAFDVQRSIITNVRVRPGRIDRPIPLQAPVPKAQTTDAGGGETKAAPTSIASAPLAAAIVLAAKQRTAQQMGTTVPPKVKIGEPSAIDISQINPRRGTW